MSWPKRGGVGRSQLADDERIMQLKRICQDVRRDIVRMIHAGGSGHPGGSLSVVEILTALYFEGMKVNPEDPGWPGRDRLILSKGHASSALYSVLARRGYFPIEELLSFNAPGSGLQKHIDMLRVPGVEVSSGSLGQGLSVGIGMALADRLDGRDRKVFVVLSDGECQAGQTWEAAMAAAHYGLGKLIAFVDRNRLQTDGTIGEIMGISPLEDKWRAFGWGVQSIDGHDLRQILDAIRAAEAAGTWPQVVIAATIKGKGVSFMENSVPWHSHPIDAEQLRVAMAELDIAQREIDPA
jgi:transketolase